MWLLAALVVLVGASPPALAELSTNLEAYWRFEGNGQDDSSHNYTMFPVGGAGYSSGLRGQALTLPGNTSSYADRTVDGSAFDFGSGDFALQVWVDYDRLDVERC